MAHTQQTAQAGRGARIVEELPIACDHARELLGRVMGLVSVAVGFAALGTYLGGDLSGATGLE